MTISRDNSTRLVEAYIIARLRRSGALASARVQRGWLKGWESTIGLTRATGRRARFALTCMGVPVEMGRGQRARRRERRGVALSGEVEAHAGRGVVLGVNDAATAILDGSARRAALHPRDRRWRRLPGRHPGGWQGRNRRPHRPGHPNLRLGPHPPGKPQPPDGRGPEARGGRVLHGPASGQVRVLALEREPEGRRPHRHLRHRRRAGRMARHGWRGYGGLEAAGEGARHRTHRRPAGHRPRRPDGDGQRQGRWVAVDTDATHFLGRVIAAKGGSGALRG